MFPRKLGVSKTLSLITFFSRCYGNILKAFVVNRDELCIITDLNSVFLLLKDETAQGKHQAEHVFLVRSYSLWKAALRVGLSGQIPECYPLIRAALETAVYCHGIYAAETEDNLLIWVHRRGPDGKVTPKHKKTFAFGHLVKEIKNESAQEFARILYEYSIEFGAHPNPKALSHGITDTNSGFRCEYLGADQESRQLSVIQLALAGLTILQIFAEILPEVFEQTQLAKQVKDIENNCLRQSYMTIPELRKEREETLAAVNASLEQLRAQAKIWQDESAE